jgi:serine/threonine-protein kinase
VPQAAERVVQSCLAKDPNDRPNTARELSESYEAALTNEPATPADAGRSSGTALTPLPRVSPRSPASPVPGGRPGASGMAGATSVIPTASGGVPAGPAAGAPPFNAPLIDPSMVVHHLEAWMPEKIATFKLRGFIQDAGGEVVESVPGRIRVRLGGRGSAYSIPGRSSLS